MKSTVVLCGLGTKVDRRAYAARSRGPGCRRRADGFKMKNEAPCLGAFPNVSLPRSHTHTSACGSA